jgi:hypothetical protein
MRYRLRARCLIVMKTNESKDCKMSLILVILQIAVLLTVAFAYGRE